MRHLKVSAPADPANGLIPMGSPEEEATAGAENYLAVLGAHPRVP